MDEPLPDHCRCLVSAAATGPSPSPGSSWVPDGVPCPDSFVLVYDLARPTLRFCRIRGGDGARWVSQTYDLGLHEVPGKEPTQRAIGDMAAVQGAFFYLESRDALGGLVVSLADGPEPRLEPVTFHASLPKLARDAEQTVTKAYLLESDKRLFLVCLFFIGCTLERIEDVGAYVFDFTEEEWCRVSDIGDAAFLLGPGGFAASCPAARHGLKRGCVYFAWDFLGDGNDVDFHIFDLKEGTREVARPNQDIPALNIEPFWLVPVLP
ncbi:hypothetical protein BS78_03G051900 [Paspalum vaginatum]|nr:hypothetical protein BS78_03G051900 [Paspalum vaginatum]